MKTIMKIAVLMALLPLVCGCDAERKSEKTKTSFTLVRTSHDIYGNPCQTLRFNTIKKEDARDTAMKAVADQWNRNLHMRRPSLISLNAAQLCDNAKTNANYMKTE